MQRPHAAVAAALMSLSLLATHRAQSQTPGRTLTASPQAIAEFRQAWAAAEINNAQPAITHLKAALGLDPCWQWLGES